MLKKLIKQDLGKLLILAVLLRLLIMPFYFHPDIKTYNFQSAFLKKGVFNIYTYLEAHKDKLPLKEEFVYFPLTYLFLGSYQVLATSLLGSGFDEWVSDASFQSRETVGVYRYLFLLKLPYLFFDIAIAFLLTFFVKELNDKKKLFTLWLFNPLSIILIYVYSNVDIFPVALSVLSLLLAFRNKFVLSALILGIAAGFKAYPLVFLPFLLLYEKDIKKVILMVLVSLGSFFAIIFPFSSTAFQNAALVSGLTTRIVSFGISLGFEQILIPFIIIVSAIFFLRLFKNDKAIQNLLFDYIIVLLLVFSFVHFHIQWLLWIVPFVVLLSVFYARIFKPVSFLVFIALLIPLLLKDSFMTISLLMSYSLLYNLLPTPFTIIQRFYDPYTIQSILHSIFTGGSLTTIAFILKRNSNET